MARISAKRLAFVREYLVDLNATQAAIRAGYSKSRADAIGYDLLRNTEISAEIARLMAERSARVELKSDRVLKEISRILCADIRKIMHPNGRIKMPHELDDDTAAAIASFKLKADGEIEYKFWDKNSALEKAMKHLGQYVLDNKQKTDPLRDLLQSLGGNVMGVSGDEE